MKHLMLMLAATQLGGGVKLESRDSTPGRYEVRLTSESGQDLLTVRADGAPIDAVLRQAGEELGKQVTGLERLGRLDPLTAYLVERPVDESLQWIAGACGLSVLVRAESIQVTQDLPPFPTQPEVFDVAERAYLRFLRAHPDDPQAPAALMAKARIHESRGNLQAAVDEYESLINDYHQALELPDAMSQAADNLRELGEWQSAASRLDELASLPLAHPYHVSARIRLAEALCEIGDAQKAIFTLDALESYLREERDVGNELDSDDYKIRRLIGRSMAQSALDQPIEALRSLDLALQYDTDRAYGIQITRAQAIAFERNHRQSEASVAWLQVAEQVEGKQRERALESAARLALEAGDALGTMFIDRYAQSVDAEIVTGPFASKARARIGLETPPVRLNNAQILIEAEILLERGELQLAQERFAGLYNQRAELDDEDLIRLALGYGEAFASDDRVDSAIATLRGILPLLVAHQEGREQLYRFAAQLYERDGRIQDALAAMKGRL